MRGSLDNKVVPNISIFLGSNDGDVPLDLAEIIGSIVLEKM